MVALVAGNSPGLNLTSLATLGARGVAGNAALGRGTDRLTVNVANGNLILQNQDDILAGPGLWSVSQRTYNSQDLLAGDHRLPACSQIRIDDRATGKLTTYRLDARGNYLAERTLQGGEMPQDDCSFLSASLGPACLA